jgi:hypothetical protein
MMVCICTYVPASLSLSLSRAAVGRGADSVLCIQGGSGLARADDGQPARWDGHPRQCHLPRTAHMRAPPCDCGGYH